MIDTSEQWEYFYVPYGSKLFGTTTPLSDTDMKVVYVPSLDSLLLGRRPRAYKVRVDADGNEITDDNQPMMPGGVETEFIPLQQFVRDFLAGQTYAIEIAHAHLSFGPERHTHANSKSSYDFVTELIENFSNSEVYPMVSFAMKQTFDYVKRGERLKKAKTILDSIEDLQEQYPEGLRLDSHIKLPNEDLTVVIEVLAKRADIMIGRSFNNRRAFRTLELNSRSYLETTSLDHLKVQVKKLIESYGTRTTAAAEADVDYKSLSHAVRVYQQVIELLDTGKIKFPRPNAEFLLKIKHGGVDLESLKILLDELDTEVKKKMDATEIRRRTTELEEAAEAWLLMKLHGLYSIRLN